MHKTPYYAVIFTSVRTEEDESGYQQMADKMLELARQQPGYLGYESARQETGITISYWQDLESIHKWKENTSHKIARKLGREKWYSTFQVRICKVEKAYSFNS